MTDAPGIHGVLKTHKTKLNAIIMKNISTTAAAAAAIMFLKRVKAIVIYNLQVLFYRTPYSYCAQMQCACGTTTNGCVYIHLCCKHIKSKRQCVKINSYSLLTRNICVKSYKNCAKEKRNAFFVVFETLLLYVFIRCATQNNVCCEITEL